MAKWKLTRQSFGADEYTFSEGDEVTIGRCNDNSISLASIVISRQHCVLKVFKDKITIIDLKSSNGTYLGHNKIPPETPVAVRDSQCIGIGWIEGAGLANVDNNEKYVFKVTKVEKSIKDRIAFQNDSDEIEEKLAALDSNFCNISVQKSPKLSLKRKSDDLVKKEIVSPDHSKFTATNSKLRIDIVNLLSDSENEDQINKKHEIPVKKIKLEAVTEENEQITSFKTEVEDVVDVDIKQEILGYDDEPINVDSDSESDSDTERRWYIRLSQSSPGKPLKCPLLEDVVDAPAQDSSYSQIIDDRSDSLICNNEEELLDDLITIPPQIFAAEEATDEVDNNVKFETGISSNYFAKQLEKEQSKVASTETSPSEPQIDILVKKAQIIEPIAKSSKRKSRLTESKTKDKSNNTTKHSKSKQHSETKKKMSNSQKEERKKKLKEIATKEKECKDKNSSHTSSTAKVAIIAKVSSSNRGAFLTETATAVHSMKGKESPHKSHKSHNKHSESKKKTRTSRSKAELNITQDIENNDKSQTESEENQLSKSKSEKKEKKSSKEQSKSITNQIDNNLLPSKKTELRVPLKNLRPLTDSDDTNAGKPVSKVEPFPSSKPKKTVRFSTIPPQVKFFEIEPGHQMKKTSLVKATLLDIPKKPIFSLEKITLVRILRWNPHWLSEQINNHEPPPILGYSTPPMSLLHFFQNHTQYVQVVGDLLLMEIWESLTQAFMKQRNQEYTLQMSIEYLPPAPTPETTFDIYNISVNVSLPKIDSNKNQPRLGDLMLVTFGPENARISRFFYVHNVKNLPSPPNNIYAFFSVSLHTVFTEKMRNLRRGEALQGRILCYIKNVLQLFETLVYLAKSPLCDAILRPDPRHYSLDRHINMPPIKSQWTVTLNDSQMKAVMSSVAAALSDKPSIQMIQGPPGTGKSSVICSIVMSYFYDEHGKRLQGRGKILICATSNAAVDELVIRLLNIRQSLPKNERFRMVRVGREDAMHPKAREVSSQCLALRDTHQRCHQETANPAVTEEIARQEARLNMWHSQAVDSKDPARTAYCQFRIDQIRTRINQLKSGTSSDVSAEQVAMAERRIVERADIVVSTLSSAGNHKMKELRRRIALCVVDEAGQAIEPDTLIPLTLDVTHLTLIGDPQQLPGFIKSQRAKQHGLAESLFSRLSSAAEHWPGGGPVVLLNKQYRMHPEIADYPNRAFYDGKICNAATLRTDHPLPPYSIVFIASGDKGQGASGANELESWGVTRLVVALSSLLRSLNMNLAVITPYDAQRESIKKNLRMLEEPNAPQVEVNTVDSFQGQERDVVVVSLARSRGVGFLSDAGRMNVMMTRARHCLLVCLNPNAVHNNQQWRTLIDDAQKRKLYKYLPIKECQPITAQQSINDNILKYITR